jgi:hypothetical protein
VVIATMISTLRKIILYLDIVIPPSARRSRDLWVGWRSTRLESGCHREPTRWAGLESCQDD